MLKSELRILLFTVLLAFMGQMILNPILAPLARKLGLAEWHIGAAISTAAIMFALFAGVWGRASLRWGTRRVLLLSMLLGFIALASFAYVSHIGLSGYRTTGVLVVLILLTRGVLYGSAIAAVAPSSQTYIVTHTVTESERIKGVGALGASQGIASILGAIIGGALAAYGGIMLPLVVMPVMMVAGICVLLLFFHPSSESYRVEKPAAVHYRDPRVFPFLSVGLLNYISFASVGTIFGFLLQDGLQLEPSYSAGLIALCMAVMGVAMILGQAVVAPLSKWKPAVLLRRGTLMLCLGVACLMLPAHLGSYLVACTGVGVGMGLALTGYNAGPTALVEHHEQGGLAGILNANGGIAYAVAPIGSTALYSWNHTSPLIVCIGICAISTLWCYFHPALRRAAVDSI
ncbi:MFS transporter [Arcanobacterium phocisimile]|uniref:MFS transporter n=1 Tax=Arcanobacterium phocisimile TaxID=1302235 RepID=A0ABX7IGG6_9ACTO|nr:MFS transporter [Arcanobacterium phocisimile]QRV01659.1 MFS transporter [Arcanobacterium phocisimile]